METGTRTRESWSAGKARGVGREKEDRREGSERDRGAGGDEEETKGRKGDDGPMRVMIYK